MRGFGRFCKWLAEVQDMATAEKERSALLTLSEAAAVLGVSRNTMRQLVAANSLDAVRISGLAWPRYRRSDLEALIEGGRP
jgi:excisionase family DNA binding protein